MVTSKIGRLAVCYQGFIFEITDVKLEGPGGKMYKGVDIFSGVPRESNTPRFLDAAAERTLKEILVQA